jgi:hypothetical protein
MTRRILSRPSGIVSPGLPVRYGGVEYRRVSWRPVLELELEDEGHSVLPSVVGWGRTAAQAYRKAHAARIEREAQFTVDNDVHRSSFDEGLILRFAP